LSMTYCLKHEAMMLEKKADTPSGLRLIRGGLQREISIGSLRIVAGPEDKPPFIVDAVAAEEDTFLVLSADTRIREPDEHPVRLMTRLIETRPETPGSVLVKGGRPLRLFAIIHDFNEEPSWREEWIGSALEGIFREMESRRLGSIALPLLGTLHGSFEEKSFVMLLGYILKRISHSHLKQLWLIVPVGAGSRIIDMLEAGMK